MKTKDNLIWSIFTIIGTILLIIGIILCIFKFNYHNKSTTTGIITYITSNNNQENHQVYVSYQVGDKLYESPLNGYSSSYYEGKEIEIYYDKANPDKIGVKSLDLLFLILHGLGLIFTTIGGTGLLINLNHQKKYQRLKNTGTLIYADYIETTINYSININNSHPYNIICEWTNPKDNKKYVFKSANIWINPSSTLTSNPKIPVYIDDKYNYYVDTDSITNNYVDLK